MATTDVSPPTLSAAALQKLLSPLDVTVELVARSASTNTDLLTRARKRNPDLPPQVLRIALEQTAGRGRFDRQWVSPSAQAALTFSYGMLWPEAAQSFAGLPLVVGLALQRALATLGAPVQLKWPNDVLFAGRKLAGILVESVMQGGAVYVVIGIGLNLDLPSHIRLQIAQPVADLREALQSSAAALAEAPDFAQQILAAIVPELQRHLQQYRAQGFAAFSAAWNAVHLYQDKPVQLLDGATVVATGIARGVDEYGQLLIETASGMRRLRSGDISLRPL
ncbi:MAG: biotin--[acetyl-CoA-carboxylase] ligase [Burkholderiaceae bacterium]|nr:MAG: biotin--[acetyl-CoA-carboxylase] ligase [Burkholderiaceae bacterium]